MNNLLIVEDDVPSQDLLLKIFRHDYKVNVCESAEEFYNKCSGIIYDAVIMDISIKGSKDGIQLIKEMKQIPELKNTAILCLTAHILTHVRQDAFEAGADQLIVKPVRNDVLKECISNLIEKKKSLITDQTLN